MTRPIIREHNTETDEVIDREMNDVEFTQYQSDQTAEVERLVAEQAILDAKASRDAKLVKMGFTLEEIANW